MRSVFARHRQCVSTRFKAVFTLLQGLSLSNLAVASAWHSTTPVTLRSAASTTTTTGGFRAHSDGTLSIVVHYCYSSPHSQIQVGIRNIKKHFIQTAVLSPVNTVINILKVSFSPSGPPRSGVFTLHTPEILSSLEMHVNMMHSGVKECLHNDGSVCLH